MPCSTCGTEVVYVDQWPGSPKCPNCDNVPLVSKPLSIEISRRRLEYLDQLFLRGIQEFTKNQLISHIVWEREKFARSFFDEYQVFRIGKFVAYSLLIKKIMAQKQFKGNLVADERTTQQLVDLFSEYIGHLTDHIYLEDGLGELMAKGSFDSDNIPPEQMLSNFVVVKNQRFLPIHSTFANNQIYDKEEAKRKFEEYKREEKTT